MGEIGSHVQFSLKNAAHLICDKRNLGSGEVEVPRIDSWEDITELGPMLLFSLCCPEPTVPACLLSPTRPDSHCSHRTLGPP